MSERRLSPAVQKGADSCPDFNLRIVASGHHSERAFRLTLQLELTSGPQPPQTISQSFVFFRSFNEIALLAAAARVACGMICNTRAANFVHAFKS